ncbi:hypothetical protein HDU97_009727 [Phlyctochytrium planicorne]|nr:hypothetical protein HDU97_009727 [Phlyctochytrium planicorne]
MISDGFGPASQTLARNAFVEESQLPYNTKLPLDDILGASRIFGGDVNMGKVGSSRTRSSSSLVTDSAAGATAFACAIKTYNGAIGMNASQMSCGTILEAAKERGYLTGLVATSRITHATPASFSAHVIDRNMEDNIALYQLGDYSLGRNVDLINDAAAHVREILAYNKAIDAVRKWVDDNPGNPNVILRVQNSTSSIAAYLAVYNKPDLAAVVKSTVIPCWLGLNDSTTEELDFLGTLSRPREEYENFLNKMISNRALLGWSTHGHSAVDVNLVSLSPSDAIFGH